MENDIPKVSYEQQPLETSKTYEGSSSFINIGKRSRYKDNPYARTVFFSVFSLRIQKTYGIKTWYSNRPRYLLCSRLISSIVLYSLTSCVPFSFSSSLSFSLSYTLTRELILIAKRGDNDTTVPSYLQIDIQHACRTSF